MVNKKGRIYISGKISGLPYEDAKRNFKEAEKYLRKCYPGAKIINPMRWCLPRWMPWKAHMIVDIVKLFTCTHLFLLTNWTDSRGSRIEKSIASETGLRIMYQ